MQGSLHWEGGFRRWLPGLQGPFSRRWGGGGRGEVADSGRDTSWHYLGSRGRPTKFGDKNPESDQWDKKTINALQHLNATFSHQKI